MANVKVDLIVLELSTKEVNALRKLLSYVNIHAKYENDDIDALVDICDALNEVGYGVSDNASR